MGKLAVLNKIADSDKSTQPSHEIEQKIELIPPSGPRSQEGGTQTTNFYSFLLLENSLIYYPRLQRLLKTASFPTQGNEGADTASKKWIE